MTYEFDVYCAEMIIVVVMHHYRLALLKGPERDKVGSLKSMLSTKRNTFLGSPLRAFWRNKSGGIFRLLILLQAEK
jgi:hypothetical protein